MIDYQKQTKNLHRSQTTTHSALCLLPPAKNAHLYLPAKTDALWYLPQCLEGNMNKAASRWSQRATPYHAKVCNRPAAPVCIMFFLAYVCP